MEIDEIFDKYKEALNRCVDEVKLTAYHTKEAAEQTEKTATNALVTVHHVREFLKDGEKHNQKDTGNSNNHHWYRDFKLPRYHWSE